MNAMTFRPEYDPNTGAQFADPSTYTIVPLERSTTGAVVASEEDVPVKRPPSRPSEIATRPREEVTRPSKQAGTIALPATYEIPEHIPREPTVALHRPEFVDPAGRPPPYLQQPPLLREPDPDGVTTVSPSAENVAADVEDDFDRIAWVADRMTSSADALGADGRPRTAAILRGLAAGMTMGPTPGPLERVGARLVQRALLADAGVAEIDDEAIGRLLMDMAAEILAGVDPTRRAARAIARQLDERAADCRTAAEVCRRANNLTGVDHHLARADELSVQARQIRRTHR